MIYTVPDDQRLMLDLSKNIIVHLFVDRALVSVALLAPPGPPAARPLVRERVQSLSRLFKLEFMFRADAPFERIFDETVGDMVAARRARRREGDALGLRPRPRRARRARLGHLLRRRGAELPRGLPRRRARARACSSAGRSPRRSSPQRALRIGEQMFLGGEIERSEAVSQPTLENAFAAFVEQGYLERKDGKLALAESFASEDAAETIEARVASYLLPLPPSAAGAAAPHGPPS